MTSEQYTIHYETVANVSFPSKKGMEKHLEDEKVIWGSFLHYISLNLNYMLFNGHVQNVVRSFDLAAVFDLLISNLDDQSAFNKISKRHSNNVAFPPPPSTSVEGLLILALFVNGSEQRALSAYLHFILKNSNIRSGSPSDTMPAERSGGALIEAAHVAHALPYHKVSSERFVETVSVAQNHVDALSDQVSKAKDVNADHQTNLETFYSTYKAEAERLDKIIRKLNQRRKKQQDAEFKRLRDLFENQLRLRAPVKLWETRQGLHTDNSKNAMTRFVVAVAITITFGLVTPFWFGDYIASSFFEIVCIPSQVDAAATETCERLFSAKGPLTVTGLLLVTSLLMWIARLQYRIHLSERHLALDASEKKAFAETYLAMKEGEDVGKDNEAIVLASLFRPTQDGIIRDDETGMDISAAALLAKQFSRN